MITKTNNINEVLEKVKKMDIEDQIYVSDVIHKRLIDEQRNKIVMRAREVRENYKAGKTKALILLVIYGKI